MEICTRFVFGSHLLCSPALTSFVQNNIRVATNGTVKIIDFGLSKIYEVTGYTSLVSGRNPRYVPPELVPNTITEDQGKVAPTFESDILGRGRSQGELLTDVRRVDQVRNRCT